MDNLNEEISNFPIGDFIDTLNNNLNESDYDDFLRVVNMTKKMFNDEADDTEFIDDEEGGENINLKTLKNKLTEVNPEKSNTNINDILCCVFKYVLCVQLKVDDIQNNKEKAKEYIKIAANMENKECLLFLVDSKKTSFEDKIQYCEIMKKIGNSEYIKKCGDAIYNSRITENEEFSETEIKHNELCDRLAMEYYKIAADNGDLGAIRIYAKKLGDKLEAVKYYKKAADIGDCTDMKTLIDEFRNNSTTTNITEDEIEKYYRKAIKNKWFTNARKLTTLLSKEKSVIYLRELVDQYKHYDKTLYVLAEALYNEQDKEGAAKYFKMAVEKKNDINSSIKLIDMFVKGELLNYNEQNILAYCANVLNYCIKNNNQNILSIIQNCFITLIKIRRYDLLKYSANEFYKQIEKSTSPNKGLSKSVADVYNFLSTYKGDLDSATKYCNICDKIGIDKENSDPYKLLKKAREKGINQLIGSGGFGSVYKTEDYAVKISRTKAKTPQEQEEENIKQYLINLSGGGHTKQINYENIGNTLLETFKYRSGGNLSEAMQQFLKSLSLEEKIHLFLQISIPIVKLHSNNIIHADLKPDNILLDQQRNPKIADYGLSTVGRFKRKRGTPGYTAPEINNDKYTEEYNEKVDVYSLGVLFYQIITGNKVTSNLQPDVDNLGPSNSMFSNLIKNMLNPNPKDRCLLNEAIKEMLGIAQTNGIYDKLGLRPKDLYYMEVYNEENLRGKKTALLAELKLLNEYSENLKISNKEKYHVEILNGGKESSKECKACLKSIYDYIKCNTNISDPFMQNLSKLNKKEYLLVVNKLLEARDLKLNCKIFEIENIKTFQSSIIDIKNDIEKLKNLKEKINMKNFATKEFAEAPTTINNKQLENDLVSASNETSRIFQNQLQLEQSAV